MGNYVIEFRSGKFFTNPAADIGGPLSQAMRFSSEGDAEAYIEREIPWAWANGACILNRPAG